MQLTSAHALLALHHLRAFALRRARLFFSAPHHSAAGCTLASTTPRRAPAPSRLTPAHIPPAPPHGVFLAHLARPHSPALAASAPAPSSPRRHRRHAAIAAVASPAIGAGACSPSARFHTRNATTASAALTPRAGYRTAALAPTSSSRARQRPRHHHYLSPFPSFSFARNSRARKQRVLVSRLALPRPSPAAVSASGTPLPPSSSPPSHALFAGIPAAAAAVPEIPLRPPALNLCLSPRSGARPLGVPLPPTTPRRAPALGRLTPAQIPPPPSHSVFPAHPARPRSPALATSASAPLSPRRLLSAIKKLAHICASSLLHARVLVLCACECKYECECDCAWKNVRPTVP